MRLRYVLFLVATLSIYSMCAGVAWWVSRTPRGVPGMVVIASGKTADASLISVNGDKAASTHGGERATTPNGRGADKGVGADLKGNEAHARPSASIAPAAKKTAMLGGSPAHVPAIQPVASAQPARVAPSAATYRQLAEQYLEGKQYEAAAHFYRLEGAVYRQNGDPNTAKAEETKADRWETQIGLYVDTIADRQFLEDHYTGAKFEPLYGCYLGAYAESDYSLPRLRDVSVDSPTYHEQALGTMIQKRLATAFCYCFYGDPFPVKWARALSEKGIAPQIALEPNDGLRYVRNNSYLRQFARDAASCGGPVFLRFASEMNGDWVAYNGNPDLYKAKFRLVHDLMNQLAPNVAMIWCVYPTPENNIDDYYPGDAYVDWVGVNFFSVYHHDNDPSSPAWFENATLPLRYVYAHYAARKPIAICE
nr:glycoside hydrolase family 26 protein [Armatimonadota bacterium]